MLAKHKVIRQYYIEFINLGQTPADSLRSAISKYRWMKSLSKLLSHVLIDDYSE